MNQTADFFIRGAVPETTRSYMGGLMTFLVKSDETDNRCLYHFYMKMRLNSNRVNVVEM